MHLKTGPAREIEKGRRGGEYGKGGTPTVESSLAPASAPSFSAFFSTSLLSPLILAEALWRSPATIRRRKGEAGLSQGGVDGSARTLKLLLGDFRIAARLVEVVANASSSSEAEDEGYPGLGHCVL